MDSTLDFSNLLFFKPSRIGCYPTKICSSRKSTECILEHRTSRYVTDIETFNLFWKQIRIFYNLQCKEQQNEEGQHILCDISTSKSNLTDLENDSTNSIMNIMKESITLDNTNQRTITSEPSLDGENESTVNVHSTIDMKNEQTKKSNRNISESENKQVNEKTTQKREDNFSENLQNYWNIFCENTKEYFVTKTKTIKNISSTYTKNINQFEEKESQKTDGSYENSETNPNGSLINQSVMVDGSFKKNNESEENEHICKKQMGMMHSNTTRNVKTNEKDQSIIDFTNSDNNSINSSSGSRKRKLPPR